MPNQVIYNGVTGACSPEVNPVVYGCTSNLVYSLDNSSLKNITTASSELVDLLISSSGYSLKFTQDSAIPEGDYYFTLTVSQA